MRPLFVYGTLLPERPNYYLLEDVVMILESATLADAVLYDMGGALMLMHHAGSSVKGVLVSVSAEDYDQTVARLDRLEVYDPADPENSLYLREVCEVLLEDGTLSEAWVYVGKLKHVQRLTPFGGDWALYSAENKEALEAFWENRKQAG